MLDRNFTKFLLLTPGTQQLQWQHAASENPQGSTQTMVNGQHFSGTNYQLDGTDNRDPILGIIVINPTLESIGETKITSQNYDAEFGLAVAGVVSVQTQVRHQLAARQRLRVLPNDSFQSRNPFTQFQPDPLTGRSFPKPAAHQFGASIGGPIVQNQWFFFGDYQGTRATQGGSRLLSVPTEAARARRPQRLRRATSTIRPTGQQFPRQPASRRGRLSPQAQAHPRPDSDAERAGPRQRHRDNYVASASETFDENSINVRIDGRLTDNLNMFGRYSLGDFLRDGPTAFGQGGGQELGQPRRRVRRPQPQPRLRHRLHAVADACWPTSGSGSSTTRSTCCRSTSARRRRRTPGIPGLNTDRPSRSGLPRLRRRRRLGEPGAFEFGSGLGVNRCNCPLDQDEKQWQMVGNLTKMAGNHTLQVRRRRPPRLQPARAERRAPLGRADVRERPHVARPAPAGSAWRRSCSAT